MPSIALHMATNAIMELGYLNGRPTLPRFISSISSSQSGLYFAAMALPLAVYLSSLFHHVISCFASRPTTTQRVDKYCATYASILSDLWENMLYIGLRYGKNVQVDCFNNCDAMLGRGLLH